MANSQQPGKIISPCADDELKIARNWIFRKEWVVISKGSKISTARNNPKVLRINSKWIEGGRLFVAKE